MSAPQQGKGLIEGHDGTLQPVSTQQLHRQGLRQDTPLSAGLSAPAERGFVQSETPSRVAHPSSAAGPLQCPVPAAPQVPPGIGHPRHSHHQHHSQLQQCPPISKQPVLAQHSMPLQHSRHAGSAIQKQASTAPTMDASVKATVAPKSSPQRKSLVGGCKTALMRDAVSAAVSLAAIFGLSALHPYAPRPLPKTSELFLRSRCSMSTL